MVGKLFRLFSPLFCSFPVVIRDVFAFLLHLKIAPIVVLFVSVLVMNILIGPEFSSQDSLHNDTMGLIVADFRVGGFPALPVLITATPLRSSIASAGAELPRMKPEILGFRQERFSALLTDQFRHFGNATSAFSRTKLSGIMLRKALADEKLLATSAASPPDEIVHAV